MIGFGRDIDGETKAFHRLFDKGAIRGRTGKVSAQPDKGLGTAIKHRTDGGQNIVTVIARNRETEFLFQGIKEGDGRFFVDSHRAVALHI